MFALINHINGYKKSQAPLAAGGDFFTAARLRRIKTRVMPLMEEIFMARIQGAETSIALKAMNLSDSPTVKDVAEKMEASFQHYGDFANAALRVLNVFFQERPPGSEAAAQAIFKQADAIATDATKVYTALSSFNSLLAAQQDEHHPDLKKIESLVSQVSLLNTKAMNIIRDLSNLQHI